MISFASDYLEGCHEVILQALIDSDHDQQPGYGADKYCESAKEKIREACELPQADIWFLHGGTQTNQIVIDSMLAPYEGVVSAESGHINTHEAGAIEFSGHKVLTLPSHHGKIDPYELDDFLKAAREDENVEHMVFPGMVYLSHPTELGTLYTSDELFTISGVCEKYKIPLYLDGARLAYALRAHETDVTLPLIARLCDVFYIGGTKCGALCGEALVFTHNNTPSHFLTRIKQHGALSAKGRIYGIQFDALFTKGLYSFLGSWAIDMADQLKEIITDCGIPFYLDSPTNQQFVILKNDVIERLRERVGFEIWMPYGDKSSVVRFVTSWATTQEQLDELKDILSKECPPPEKRSSGRRRRNQQD